MKGEADFFKMEDLVLHVLPSKVTEALIASQQTVEPPLAY